MDARQERKRAYGAKNIGILGPNFRIVGENFRASSHNFEERGSGYGLDRSIWTNGEPRPSKSGEFT